MRTLKKIILLLIISTTLSCQDRNNVIVTGQITDELTGNPIPNSEVVVLCWYMNSIDDASFNKQTLKTDSNGNYIAKFEKGHQVDVASKYSGYNPNRSYNKLKDNKINVNLKLSKSIQNKSLITLLNTDNVDAPFMRVRIYADKGNTKLNFNNWETFGFNFKTMSVTNDTLNADIWFDKITKEEQPKIIKTNKLGGVIPIDNNEVKSSVLFEKGVAPNNGYLTSYNLKGNEEGFFVKCRDGKTYGKIILEKSEIDHSGPDGKGNYIKEFGKNISCLYQPDGTTNLTYQIEEIDLEDFLVDFRMN
jgi:hypothetical protein